MTGTAVLHQVLPSSRTLTPELVAPSSWTSLGSFVLARVDASATASRHRGAMR